MLEKREKNALRKNKTAQKIHANDGTPFLVRLLNNELAYGTDFFIAQKTKARL